MQYRAPPHLFGCAPVQEVHIQSWQLAAFLGAVAFQILPLHRFMQSLPEPLALGSHGFRHTAGAGLARA
jgi:hypothetical protein